jgi:hypothetical protein
MTARLAISTGLLLSACASIPADNSEPVRVGEDRPAATICLAEPGTNEVVVVINDNSAVASHVGLFAGASLSDPSGTYLGTRPLEDKTWKGPTLRDYLAYQMKDGPKVRSYRFTLAQPDFAAIESRLALAGWTMPLFCAASVQNHLAGIGPFNILDSVWWTSPRELDTQMQRIIQRPEQPGRCEMPDGKPC